jgi:hypothetical protein
MRRIRALVPLLLAFAILTAPAVSHAQVAVGISVRIAPPALPVYVQPPLPGPGYIWTPGYWAYGPAGYYWVPGTWVLPPSVGLLWTPGYWGWRDGLYVWNAGYWGPRVGFYGGVNYGFGYVGTGYVGGFWAHGVFNYNHAANNFGSVHVTNVYNKTIANNTTVTRVSFNGGPGGLGARPSAAEEAASHDPHTPPSELQSRHEQAASANHASLASVNHGHPTVAATSRAGEFHGQGVVGTRAPGPVHNVNHQPGPPTGHGPSPGFSPQAPHGPGQPQGHEEPHGGQPQHGEQHGGEEHHG